MAATRKIAIIGAGLVGSGWAVVFARAGYDVQVYDPVADVRQRVRGWAAHALDDLAAKGLADNAALALSKITVFDSMEAALSGANYVQESVFETVESKTSVSLEIDVLIGPQTIVGSSSSGIPASQFTENCGNRSRFMVAHPVNPPHLIPLVELVPAPWTDPDALRQAKELMTQVGQVPVVVNKEIDGFILNRLQGALLNEAWALFEDGYASLEDIDATIRDGLGLRWSFMGPFETIDLNAPGGIADYAARFGGMYHAMGHGRKPNAWPDDLILKAEAERRQSIAQSDLPERRAWRDRKLTSLVAFKKQNGLTR